MDLCKLKDPLTVLKDLWGGTDKIILYISSFTLILSGIAAMICSASVRTRVFCSMLVNGERCCISTELILSRLTPLRIPPVFLKSKK